MISLAAGAPNPDLFPYESAEIKLRYVKQNLSKSLHFQVNDQTVINTSELKAPSEMRPADVDACSLK